MIGGFLHIVWCTQPFLEEVTWQFDRSTQPCRSARIHRVQYVKSNFFLPFDPFVDRFSKESIVFFLCPIHPYGRPNVWHVLHLVGEWTDGSCWKCWKLEGFLWISSFCESWQTSIVCFCQSWSRQQRSRCSTHVKLQRFFVGGRLAIGFIADGIQVTPFTQFSTAKAALKWFKIAGSKSSLAVVNGTHERRNRSCQDNFQLELDPRFPSSFHSCCARCSYHYLIPA